MTHILRPILMIALTVLALAGAKPAAAQTLDEPFKPDWMSNADLKFLQTGLTLEGLYLGLIDGEWGPGSQSALDKSLGKSGNQRLGDLLPLLQRTQIAIQTDFWQGVNDFTEKATFLAPMTVVQQDMGSDLFTLQSADGSLKIRLIENDKDKTIEMHQWLLDNHKGAKQDLYRNYTEQRLITSGVLKSGKTVYLRSEYARSKTIVTVLVQYEPWQKERGALVAASISFEGPTFLTLDQYGSLGALLRQGTQPVRPSQPVSGGGGISRPAPGTGGGQQPEQPGGGIGISRPAPGTGPTPAQPGTAGGGGIARPSAPVASMSFDIPALPTAAE